MTIKKTAISGIKWTTLGTSGTAIIQLLKVSVLTRFLPKEAFGLVAITLFLVTFSNIFLDMGITSAILHKQNSTKNEFSSIYWFNIFISIIIYFALFIGAPLFSKFYEEPELKKLIPLLGINLLFIAIGKLHRTTLQKQFQFKSIVIVELFSYSLGLGFSIILAIKNFGVYSLVYSTLFSTLLSNGLFLIQNLQLNPIRFHFRLSETKPFLKIGIYNMGSVILDFFSREVDIIIIGKTFGVENLGVYSLAKQIVAKVFTAVNPIILNVFNPIFSSIQSDVNRLRYYYNKVTNILTAINTPIYLLIIVLSKEVLIILYGENYMMGYNILNFLSIYFLLNTIIRPIGSLQIATGRTDVGLKWSLVRFIITLIVIYFASLFNNINIVAASMALISMISILIAWKIMLEPMVHIQFKEYIRQYISPLLLLGIISVIHYIISDLKFLNEGMVISIIFKVTISMFLYFGLLRIIDRITLKNMVSLLLNLK